MTEQEFFERTGARPDFTEFDAIHRIYVMSDYDKDDFCKWFMQGCKGYIESRKQRARLKPELLAISKKLYKALSETDDNPSCDTILTADELATLDRAGIEYKHRSIGYEWHDNATLLLLKINQIR